jgi:FMN phosphatase YigB (HAD superfamily)
MSHIKAIIFDWGRTLHDPDADGLFAGTSEVILGLSQKYKLALVSLAKSQSEDERRKTITESGIAEYFEIILIGEENKEDMYEEVIQKLALSPREVAVVDDRVVRGISWGNKCGAVTIWFQYGKFADELPTEETGTPTTIISDIRELQSFF